MKQTIVNARHAWAGRTGPHLVAAWLVAGLLAGCDDASDQAPPAAAAPPAVSVVEVEPQNVTPSTQFVGRVVAIDQVDLRARVQGFLEQRLFTEGQVVKKGDLLFVIEQPPFEAQVAEAQAQVARAEASVAEANATLERVQQAVTSGAVSKQEVDQARANAQRAQAEVLAAQAEVQIAQLNLGYTEIEAPIAGRIGRSNFTVGNLVGPDSGVLATIVSNDPIYVTFPVSTRIILEVRKQAIEAGQPAEFVVRAQLPDGTMYGHPGKLNFLDIQVDQTTDTVAVRAEFPNPEGLLVDGQFVNVTVEQEKPEERLVVPQAAQQIDQAGTYVLVVNGQDQVEQRRIQTGQTYGSNLVVQSGLQAGDRVIVEGIQKVRPGMTVQANVVPLPPTQLQTQPQASQPETEPGSEPEAGEPADQTPPAAGAPAQVPGRAGAAQPPATAEPAPASQPATPPAQTDQ